MSYKDLKRGQYTYLSMPERPLSIPGALRLPATVLEGDDETDAEIGTWLLVGMMLISVVTSSISTDDEVDVAENEVTAESVDELETFDVRLRRLVETEVSMRLLAATTGGTISCGMPSTTMTSPLFLTRTSSAAMMASGTRSLASSRYSRMSSLVAPSNIDLA